MSTTDDTSATRRGSGSNDLLGLVPERDALPAPVGFRSRYRSEPGMIGHYPWTYADWRRRKHDRPECEYEDLFTRKQVLELLAAASQRPQSPKAASRQCNCECEACGCDFVGDPAVDTRCNACA